jgi:hypothetical protein
MPRLLKRKRCHVCGKPVSKQRIEGDPFHSDTCAWIFATWMYKAGFRYSRASARAFNIKDYPRTEAEALERKNVYRRAVAECDRGERA